MSEFEDTTEELISSEQLQIFDVVDSFCDVCGDLTPHHIDDSKAHNEDDELDPEAICLSPISTQECVVCRENEENKIDGII
jgi:hypothetical protein